MHPATPDEIEKISSYVESQDPKLKVTFAQKLHVENLYGHTHETGMYTAGRSGSG